MSIRSLIVCALTLSFAVALGCSRGQSRVYPPPINASSAGSEAIAMYDTDKDGKISGAELDKCGAFKAAIKQIDTNGDGAITAEEITNRVKAWQSSKIGQMPVRCMILHNGSTLSNAEVQFVPEKFLGESIKVAKGKTDASGMTAISIQSTEPNSSGVAPGLYRVEITKAGEKIPAKYNTETILGQEVASDAPGLRTVLQFNLKY